MIDNKNQNFIHIGLGKTSTTSLQAAIFPIVSRYRPDFTYNDPELISAIESALYDRDRKKIVLVQELLNEKKHIISKEDLVGTQPRFWEEAANRNLQMFGPNNQILITLRRPEDYMRSVYLQLLSEGFVLQDTEVFLKSSEVDALEKTYSKLYLPNFDVDAFDLSFLKNLYQERFESVSVVPYEAIAKFSFLGTFFNLDDDQICQLRRKYESTKKNRSYTPLAVAITAKRNRLLSVCGLRPLNKHDVKYLSSLHVILKKSQTQTVQSRDTKEKVQVFKRAAIYVQHIFSWTFFMKQCIWFVSVDKKFKLSEQIYRNVKLNKKNNDFYQKLIKSFE